MTLTREHQRVDDGRTLTGGVVSDEKRVLFAEGRGPDGVFDDVFVDPGKRVVLISGEHLRMRPAGDLRLMHCC